MKLTHWLSGLFFPSPRRSISRKARRSSRRHGLSEGARRLAAVERLEERLLLTSAPVFDQSHYAESIPEDAESSTWVLAVWAEDPDFDPVTYQFSAASSGAPFSIDSNYGDIYVDGPLDAGLQSEYVLTVEAVDPGGLKGTATVTITVTAFTNSPPEFGSSSYTFTVAADASYWDLIGTVSATDAENDYLWFSSNDAWPFEVDYETGEIRYGDDYGLTAGSSYSFTVIVNDDYGSDSTTVTINVTAPNNSPPEFGSSSYTFTVAADVSYWDLIGTVTATDAENDELWYSSNDPWPFEVDYETGEIRYADDYGLTAGSSYSFTVIVNDDYGSDSTTVTINVTAPNNSPPQANNDSYSIGQDQTLTVQAFEGVMANDSDPDGDALTAHLETEPMHGTLTFQQSGAFTYQGDSGFTGFDSFTYYLNDGYVDGNIATVTIEVTSGPTNLAPTAVNDAYAVTQNTPLTVNAAQGVLANDTDPENDPLTAMLEEGPSFGTLNLFADGSFTYTVETDYTGTDSFTYTVSDGQNTSNIATVTLTITAPPANSVPVAHDDWYVVALDTLLVVDAANGVLANDTDGDQDPLIAVLVDSPSHGALSLQSDGSFTFDPDVSYTGWDSFTYRVHDGTDLSNLATVTLEIGLPPVFVDDVQLVRDTGSSASDLLTWDPRITGTIQGGLGGDTLDLQFDHDGDGSPEGVLSFAFSGQSFVYNPLRFDPSLEGYTGHLPLRYRLVKRDAQGHVQTTGSWQNFAYTLESPPAVDGLTIDGFGLWRDTGELDYDRNSVHPTVTGMLAGEMSSGSARVEFDHDGDGVVDGQIELAASGETFQYDPRATDPALVEYLGDLVLDYRLVRLDASGAVVETGPWVAYDLTIVSPPPSTDTIAHLGLVNATQGGLTTWDPTLTGMIESEQSQAYRPVELDWNGDGFVDATTHTGTGGTAHTFTITPTNLAYGTVTVWARALEWSAAYHTYLRGDWGSFAFQLVPEPAPSITELALEWDTGEFDDDGITTVTRLVGQTNAPEGLLVRIEFDHDGNGTVDGTAWTEADGGFRYAPDGLASGNVTIRARAARYDARLGADVLGNWFSLSFTYEGIVAPTVSELGLLNDTGEFDDDGITADPTLTGQLDGEHVAWVTVEFDHDGDGVVNGQTVSDWSGAFTYYVPALAAGAVTVRARTAVRDYQQDTLVTSEWVSFSFTKEASTHANFEISDLALLNDTGADAGDLVTFDRRVTGTLSGSGDASYIIVEFDHDGDGVADGQTRTDAWGGFVYYATGLSLGPVTLSARTREWDLGNRVASYGTWTSLGFTLEAETNAPRKWNCWNSARTPAAAIPT